MYREKVHLVTTPTLSINLIWLVFCRPAAIFQQHFLHCHLFCLQAADSICCVLQLFVPGCGIMTCCHDRLPQILSAWDLADFLIAHVGQKAAYRTSESEQLSFADNAWEDLCKNPAARQENQEELGKAEREGITNDADDFRCQLEDYGNFIGRCTMSWIVLSLNTVFDDELTCLLALHAERYAEEVAQSLHNKAEMKAATTPATGAKKRSRPPKVAQAADTRQIVLAH
jgi:hypothetical protein